MVRVVTPSRLHFGLLSLAAEGAAWPDRAGRAVLPARRFGGVGLMVRAPGVRLRAADAAAWSAEGPLAERALGFARRFAAAVGPGAAGAPQRLTVEAASPEHVGLGAGTQLGMAVAAALAAAWRLDLDAAALARSVGRGLRSGLGVHGFARGGLLVEAGKRPEKAPVPFSSPAPLAARLDFPADWRVVLATPADAAGWHGERERAAFAGLSPAADDPARTDALCRLALLGLLPAAAEGDLEAFGEALYDFNARAGEAFAAAQGGAFSGPAVAACVDFLRREGARGVGQSSWGPTVFAVVGDADRADDLARRAAARFGLGPSRAWTAAACNRGAALERD
jgi:beta-RFAP synthase